MKKLTTLILSAMLLLQMVVPVWAETTIESPPAGETAAEQKIEKEEKAPFRQVLEAGIESEDSAFKDEDLKIKADGVFPEDTALEAEIKGEDVSLSFTCNKKACPDEYTLIIETEDELEGLLDEDGKELELEKKGNEYKAEVTGLKFKAVFKEPEPEDFGQEEQKKEETAEAVTPEKKESAKEESSETDKPEAKGRKTSEASEKEDTVKESSEKTEAPSKDTKKSAGKPKEQESSEGTTLIYTGDDYTVTLESPETFENTTLTVKELPSGTEDYNRYLTESASAAKRSVEYFRVFDIKLLKDGKETEPDRTVAVSIELDEKLAGADVIHFAGKKEKAEVLDTEVDGGTIRFETDSFSAYAIVSGPESVDVGLVQLTDLTGLTSEEGLYVANPGGYYFTNTLYNVNNTSRTGIKKTALGTDPTVGASRYYFESAGNGKYYAYCFSDTGERKYVKNDNNNSLQFSASAETAFTVEMDANGTVLIHNGNWYWNMQGGVNGKGFCSYGTNASTDPNSRLYLYTRTTVDEDPYDLSGKTYGLMSYNNGMAGKAILEENGTLNTVAMQILNNVNDRTDVLYVPKGSDITKWTFEWVSDTNFYIKSGNKYLKLEATGVSMSTEPVTCRILANNGKIQIRSDSVCLRYSGEDGFTVSTASDANTWLNLVSEREITQDYVATYTAKKVSVSDAEAVINGSAVIIYTRKWNNSTKKYDLYAIDHDGTLIPCTDAGDSIKWIGPAINTLLWDFTEHYFESTHNPNYYYDLQNEYSGMYIAPQKTGDQVLSDSPIGVNLVGRRYNEYYTSITAWDDPSYSYAALKAGNEGEILSCSITQADDFFFAIMDETSDEDGLDTVSTIDHTKYGITMKIADYSSTFSPGGGSPTTSREQHNVIGDSTGGSLQYPNSGLLTTNLDSNGYPTATITGKSLGELFSNAREVNHLFLADTYNSTGYYEYDSTQNFASLQSDGTFKVYKNLGTNDIGQRPSLQHGQFLPFNDITEGVYSAKNPENLYDAMLNELPESYPRKHEPLYLVDNPNYYFGMEIEASFVQTPSGLDNWGHDIIYEFTGDDDFWLYVDGELIIDLGGIHSALPGSVNYSTGEVNVNGTHTTLRNLFKSNYETRNPSATAAEVNTYLDGIFEQNEHGQYAFKDYSSHTMKIFFMERGAGASNLHMKFNLSSIKPGQVILNKQISGTSKSDYRLTEYGYQVWYQTEDEGPYHLLSNLDSHLNVTVSYQNTTNPVKFKPHYTPPGSTTTYENVFFLTPSQTVAISVPDDTIRYKIVECGVNAQVYDSVKINDVAATGTLADGSRYDFATAPARVADRQRVVFDNHVNQSAERNLTITKKLFDVEGNAITDDTTGFNFRLYLGNENDADPPAANTIDYHVKDPSGNYCYWNTSTQSFASLGKTDFSTLTAIEKEAATFQTSPNGAISKIPANYKVEVRELLVGTKFKVEERTSEIPAGYSFIGYEREGSSYIIHGDTVNTGTIRDNESPAIEIHNRRGFGLTVKKEWSDTSFMSSHDETFFGVYAGQTLIDVKRLAPNKKNLYWYFDTLRTGCSLSDYNIKEVALSGQYTTDGETVSGIYTATPVENGETIAIGATSKNGSHTSYAYTATYAKGHITGAANNTRTDTVINSRQGIKLVKENTNGSPLGNAVFRLTNSAGDAVGDETYTSGSDGLITIAYLSPGEVYTLTETVSPSGYLAQETPLKFRMNNDGTITVTQGDFYTITQASGSNMAVITVKNRPMMFSAIKQNTNGEPLEDAHFDLYRQITIGGTSFIDFNPIPGYTNLTTGADGHIPLISQNLAPGTYYLKESLAPNGYDPIEEPVCFTISPTGHITADETSYTELESKISNGTMTYTLKITDAQLKIIPTGTPQVNSAFKWFLLIGVVIAVICRRQCRKMQK